MDPPTLRGAVLGILHLLTLVVTVSARQVYMDKYGHCQAENGFSLEEEVTLRHVGGGLPHETLICTITFRARENRGVCIYFRQLSIRDCGVTLKIFQSSSASGTYWRRVQCKEDKPQTMCTTGRYVTIKLQKETMNQNRNYNFELLIKENDKLSEKNVLIVSIGIYVGIIIGVIALIAGLAILIICCCCKRSKTRGDGYKPPPANPGPPTDTALQPTAPAPEFPDGEQGMGQGSHLYPTIPSLPHDHPPPYEPCPPPYSCDPCQESQPLPLKV